jgi:RNA polymerase sigma factor (sigma-70 family)
MLNVRSPRFSSPAGIVFPVDPSYAMKADMAASIPVEGDSHAALGSLLQGVSRGDPSALSELYDRTSAKLYGICLRLLADDGEAQDVLQEVYMSVWRRADQFDQSRGSPIAWLATIARNRSLDRLRSRPRAAEPIEAAIEIADDRATAFDLASAGQERVRLASCLDGLEERPRTMIRAAFLEGRSYPELAAAAAVPLPTMKSWIRRGLQQLRGCLEAPA